MIYSIFLYAAAFIFGSCSPGNDENPIKIDLVTSEGNTMEMTGRWFSGCVNINDASLEEVFTFDGQSVTIDINFFSEQNCQGSHIRRQVINLDITDVGETYVVQLGGREVIANKISGTQQIGGEPETEHFKQAFFIDDSGDMPKLYHGIFADDGGTVTADGYPLELHNIAITKL